MAWEEKKGWRAMVDLLVVGTNTAGKMKKEKKQNKVREEGNWEYFEKGGVRKKHGHDEMIYLRKTQNCDDEVEKKNAYHAKHGGE